MRAAPPLRAKLLGVLGVATLGLACATPVDVAYDARHDWARDRTWSLQPEAGPRVHAPHGNAARLDKRVARLIESELFARGLERTDDDDADLVVSYRLSVRRFAALVNVPVANDVVDSPFSRTQFVSEGASRPQTFLLEDVRLGISVSQAPGQTLWHASLVRRVDAEPEPPLEDLVAALLERYPRSAEQSEADPQR